MSIRKSLPAAVLPLCLIIPLLILTGCGAKSGSSDASTVRSSAASSQGAEVASGVDPLLARAGVTEIDLAGSHDPPADVFHPDKNEVTPALGGRVIMHIASEPPNLNMAIESSAVIRHIHREIHAGILEFNMATWEYDPVLAESYDVEDTIILEGGRGEGNTNVVFGKVRDDGDAYVVTSGSDFNDVGELRIPKSDVESVELGTVFTFRLRDDVLWHDGETYDAQDALFSWRIYYNPHVDCDEKRTNMQEIVHGEILDPHVVRFFYKRQYFQALPTFELAFCQLPSHLYDLKDPSNKDFDSDATELEQGNYINDNPHNIDWVGLGPYKLTAWERGRYLEARRFESYRDKDPRKAGYLDVLRWTHVDDDNLAFQALLNGELDIFDRVKSEDFLGAATAQEIFTRNFYKAFTYVGSLGYSSWNLHRDKFKDVRVRTALAYAFDVKEWIRTNYEGLALPATATTFWFGPGYNHDVDVLPCDPERAQELLAEAGWYDRNGNGIIDKDGVEFEIEALMPSGNKASETFLQKMQESYEKVGIKLSIQPFEWATFLERILDRDFDSCNLAWVFSTPESDPLNLWHSSEAAMGRRTSNHSGLADDLVDQLIEKGRRELDPETRYAIWRELHARVYELQPYLFGWNVPKKIAFNKKLRGVKLYKFSPGYQLRDMYYEAGTPGTRPLEAGV